MFLIGQRHRPGRLGLPCQSRLRHPILARGVAVVSLFSWPWWPAGHRRDRHHAHRVRWESHPTLFWHDEQRAEGQPDERQHHRRRRRLVAALLTDLKSGYLLGANPRKQFIAQFAGIFVGTVVTVLVFRYLVYDPSVLGSKQISGSVRAGMEGCRRSACAWNPPPSPGETWSMAVGGLIGIILPISPCFFRKRENGFLPPPAWGWLGLSKWYYSLLFLLGAVLATDLKRPRRRRPRSTPSLWPPALLPAAH